VETVKHVCEFVCFYSSLSDQHLLRVWYMCCAMLLEKELPVHNVIKVRRVYLV